MAQHLQAPPRTWRRASTPSRVWGLGRPLLHVIDREADGRAQFRRWSAAGHHFVVPVDANRRVVWGGASRALPEVAGASHARGALVPVRSRADDAGLAVAWRVARDRTSAGRARAKRLVRLSGRQMKRSEPVTASAVLAGLDKVLAVLDVSVEELRQLLRHVLSAPPNTG